MTFVRSKYRGTTTYDLVHAKVTSAAKDGVLIFYKEVYELMGLEDGINAGIEAGQILSEITEEAHVAGKPMLSSIVVNKSKGIPGSGFFVLAKELKKLPRNATEAQEYSFWKQECDRVFSTQW